LSPFDFYKMSTFDFHGTAAAKRVLRHNQK
jgi:hypothetical protein